MDYDSDALRYSSSCYASAMPATNLHDDNGHPYAHHAAKVDPVTPTTCGLDRAPASSKWAVVSCPECLRIGARSEDAARTRLRVLEGRGRRS